MQKRKPIGLLVLVIVSFIFLFNPPRMAAQQESGSQETGDPIDFLNLVITPQNPINLDNKHVTEAIPPLRFQYGCPISIEIIAYTQQDSIPIEQGNLWLIKDRPVVTRSFSNLTVRQFLDELVEIDPAYRWKVYDNRVVFEPRTKQNDSTEKSILETRVSVSATDVPLTVLLSPTHSFGRELFYNHGLGFTQVVLTKDPELNKVHLSITRRNVTLREAFNAIAAAAEVTTGDRFCWSIMGRKIEGPDANGRMVTIRDFTFNRFRQEFLDRVRNSP